MRKQTIGEAMVVFEILNKMPAKESLDYFGYAMSNLRHLQIAGTSLEPSLQYFCLKTVKKRWIG